MVEFGEGKVGYRDLRGYLRILDEAGLMRQVKAPVELKYELGAISAHGLAVGSPTLQFENIKGYEGVPFVTNLMGTIEHVAHIFNCGAIEEEIQERVSDGLENRLPSVVVNEAPCKEVVVRGDDVDLYQIPTPVWHELDPAPFIATNAGVITKHPDTSAQNMGLYRMMIVDKNTLTCNVRGPHPVGAVATKGGYGGSDDLGGADHILTYEGRGEPAPIALAIGMDPLLILAAGTAVPSDEEGLGEFEAAGWWRGQPTELVRCETIDLLVPAQAEMIIEGYVVPGSRIHDGPHGESTGFYGENPQAFEVKVTCITHRTSPIISGLICQQIEDYPRTLLRSGSVEAVLTQKAGLSNIRKVVFPEVGRNGMLIISADIQDAEEPRRIMDAAWRELRFRWIIVVDEDCDPDNWLDVMWRVCCSVIPDRDVTRGAEFPSGGRGAEMDFIPPTYGLGIDATMKFKPTPIFPPVNKVGRELATQVSQRWKEIVGES